MGLNLRGLLSRLLGASLRGSLEGFLGFGGYVYILDPKPETLNPKAIYRLGVCFSKASQSVCFEFLGLSGFFRGLWGGGVGFLSVSGFRVFSGVGAKGLGLLGLGFRVFRV